LRFRARVSILGKAMFAAATAVTKKNAIVAAKKPAR
jgi:hypothetical protein